MLLPLHIPMGPPLKSIPRLTVILSFFILALFVGLFSAGAQTPPSWPPISAEDLALKDNPLDPGEPAMVLYYELQTDSAKSSETAFKRIKVFREEGRKYADVEIPYFEKQIQVEEIRARVTSPTGISEDFNGAIYDKEIVKMKKYRFSAKIFTLPNVEVGSIIDYSYRFHWRSNIPDVIRNPSQYLINHFYAYPAAEWEIQQELSLRHGHFALHPIKGARTVTFSHELPKDTIRRSLPDGSVEIDVDNIPAFQKEDYSPPEESLKIRADLFYVVGFLSDPKYYWWDQAKQEAQFYDAFIGKPKSVQREADRLLSQSDSNERKLRKIYDRVQQLRALSYEPEKSKKERKQESLKENKHAEDVLKHGYAGPNEINLAFIALARAAGFQAYPVRLAARNRVLFVPGRLDPNQLNSMVVEVLIGSKQVFLDPATIYCPFGFLPWEETDSGGIRVDATQGQMEYTPVAESKDAVTRWQAELKLDADGNVEGNLTLTYEGQEALRRRIKAIDQDEPQRHKDLEEVVQRSLPQGAVVKLQSAEAWETSLTPLKAQFRIQVPNFANKAGQRLLLPVAILHANGQALFSSNRRAHPVYFEYPSEVYDDVVIRLPPNTQVEALPAKGKIDRGRISYESCPEKQENTLHLKRSLKTEAYYILPENYLALKQFYEQVRASDEQQVILKPLKTVDKP